MSKQTTEASKITIQNVDAEFAIDPEINQVKISLELACAGGMRLTARLSAKDAIKIGCALRQAGYVAMFDDPDPIDPGGD